MSKKNKKNKASKKASKRRQERQGGPELPGGFFPEEGMPAELAELLSNNGIDPEKFLDEMVQRHLPMLETPGESPDAFGDEGPVDEDERLTKTLGHEVSRARTQKGQNKVLKEFLKGCDPDHENDFVVGVAIDVCRDHADEPQAFLETLLTHARGYMKQSRFQTENWALQELHPTIMVLIELSTYLHTTRNPRLRDKYLHEMQEIDPDFRLSPPSLLVAALIEQDDYAKALATLNDHWSNWYEEDSFAHYNRALLAYLTDGPTELADSYLKNAFKILPQIAVMLVQNIDPNEEPEGWLPEDDQDARFYLQYYLPAWRKKPGAVAWVRETLGIATRSKADEKRGQKNQQQICRQRIRQAEDWFQRADADIIIDSIKDSSGSWIVFSTVIGSEENSDDLRHIERYDHKPKPAEMLCDLMEMMSRWTDEEGYPGVRPGRVVVRLKSIATSWKKRLEKLEIECVAADQQQSEVFASLQELFGNVADHEEVNLEDVSFDDLRSLELAPEASWEVFARKMPTWANDQGKHRRLWCGVILDLSSDLLLGSHTSAGEISPEEQAQFLIASILKPMVPVPPVLPGEVRVCDQKLYEIINEPLSDLGVDVELVDSFHGVSEVLEEMAKDIMREDDPGPTLLNIPGVTERHFDDFYQATDLYYQQKPWQCLDDFHPVKIVYQSDSDKKEETHYAVVMGSGGLTFGLAFYFMRESLVQLLNSPKLRGVPPQPGESMSIIYGENFEIPIEEFDMIDERKYPIENSEAYPLFLRVRPGRAIQVPLLHELEKITACLNGVAKLVEHQLEPVNVAVNLASGKHHLSLSVESMR